MITIFQMMKIRRFAGMNVFGFPGELGGLSVDLQKGTLNIEIKNQGKTRKVQRFLYNVRPQRTGAKEKENEYGTDKTRPESNGH